MGLILLGFFFIFLGVCVLTMLENIYHVTFREESQRIGTSFIIAKDDDDLKEQIKEDIGESTEILSVSSLPAHLLLENLDFTDEEIMQIIPEYRHRKLRKRSFINNLLYTKDYLVHDEKDKKKLHNIISKL